MNTSSKHSNLNFAYHIVMYWSLFKVYNGKFTYQLTNKEKPSLTIFSQPQQIDVFRKIGRAMRVKSVSKIWVRMPTTNIHLLQFKI